MFTLTEKSIAPAPSSAARISAMLADLKARKHPRYAFLDAGTDVTERKAITDAAAALDADDLIVLGIGGSALGLSAMMNACVAPRRRRVHVLESPDPVRIHEVLAGLNPRRTAVNVVSKSGTTIETLSQWAVIQKWLGDGFKDRVVMTTDPKSGPLRKVVNDVGYRSFVVPEMIGGRYSVFTAVGLLPLAFAGVDLAAIGQGVAAAELGENSLGARLAGTLHAAQMASAKPMVVVWPYGESLQQVGRWFQQLWGESLGKATHTDGSVAHVGSTPVACLGPNDQHSLLQLFADGPKDKHFLFICPRSMPQEYTIAGSVLDYTNGLKMTEILRAEARATFAALTSQGHPASFVSIPDLGTATIARLLVELMTATVVAGGLYNVDPFDQPAVELGKRIALGLLGQASHKEEAGRYSNWLPEG